MRGFRFILILIALWFVSCQTKKSNRFQLINSSKTGIDFNNRIIENDTVNVFEYMNVYTGAGVAVGDVNNDGLTDVYFSGNMVSGRLYLNKGGLKFEDVTESAGLSNKSWGTGATMVDINQDGLLDIYVCVSGGGKEENRANLLYINNGASAESSELTFTEQASEYGLDDTRQSMHAAFFDFDKDQDLDMYLLVNPAAYEHQVNTSNPRQLDGSSISNDRLYRNEGDGNFMDITKEANVLVEGYGLGVGISDINNDSWPDIYVSNDFIGNDILYINQKDGTFKDEITDYINHTSYAGMGNDISDLDNNGKPDIMVLDMRPEDNERQKLIISSTGYDRFHTMLNAGYQPQYSRNTLQLNLGEGKFAEIGNMAGVSSTDWSWSPLMADYDNDGFKDLYVTNGFLRDLGNLDYIHYQGIYDNPLGDRETKAKLKLASIAELPPAKLVNYAYKNNGNGTFDDFSENWGISEASCSNGSAYADLDNDGDLDLLINNVNQPAFIYENNPPKENKQNYLRLKLKGKEGNLQGIGSKVKITTKDGAQYEQFFLSRGYESSVEPLVHFGLGDQLKVENLEIWWPDDSYQLLKNVSSNQVLIIDQNDASTSMASIQQESSGTPWFVKSDSTEVGFKHIENELVDFKLQPILPHMHSRNGPGVAVSDVNSDGLEDFYVGGASGQSGQLYLQNSKGNFAPSSVSFDTKFEDMGSLFFDANNDGHPDLYIVSGGVEAASDFNYQDRLYLNDGKGNFSLSNALPDIPTSGSTVNATDFDHDGDLDLFVGGRVDPGSYPMPVQSYLLENLSDGNPSNLKFKDISGEIDHWNKLTMVTSALWTDYDDDGWSDLIAVGEFMPITIFHNEEGKLVPSQEKTTLQKTEGWWNSIAGGDFDNDGDTDYILGNLGLNSKYKASAEEPLCIYANDYDKNGSVDPVMCYFIDGENYIAHTRDEIISQINAMRSRFKTYQSYAETPFDKAFLPEELEAAYVIKSHNFASSYMENQGNGKFALRDLPIAAQIAPVEGIVVEDFNHDGNIDVLLTGNNYGAEVATGRYDALLGAILKGNGDGTFKVLDLGESGFLNNYDANGLASIRNASGDLQILIANNDGPLKVVNSRQSKMGHAILSIEDNITQATVYLVNGDINKKEFYYGSGYLSNSSRSLQIHDKIKEIRLKDAAGNTKTVYHKNEIK